MTSNYKVALAKVEDIPLSEFLDMPAAPGHRNSEARAQKALHLRTLVPEHLEVEIAEYKDATGRVHRARMTGNTRAQVWKCGLSDKTPEAVRARVYPMANEQEVRERMMRHDSREASWTSGDYVFRALDMTFGGNWTPRSKALSSGRFVEAVRRVDSLVNHSRWSPDLTTNIALVLPLWEREFMLLDQLTDHPLSDAIREKKPFTWGFLGALLLLLRFRPPEVVGDFSRAIFNDVGKSGDDGKDGVQAVIENLGRKTGSGSAAHQIKILSTVVGGFERWEEGTVAANAVAKVRQCDPLEWIRNQRDQREKQPGAMTAAE